MTSRREFLKVGAALGGGVAFGLCLPQGLAQTPPGEVNAWVVVRPDDTVIIRYARSEMGQGSLTSAAQLVAEELECDWEKVRVEYADTNAQVRRERPWGEMGSSASATIRASQQYLRLAGARARETLIAAAAQAWKVPAAQCTAAQGVIVHPPSARRTTYGAVATRAASLQPPENVALKDPAQWNLAGKPLPRADIPDMVTGRARYAIDAQLPGMLHAAVAQCPILGGRLKSIDAAAIERRRGVAKVLAMEDFVAVVADNWWRAREALRSAQITWEGGSGLSSGHLHAQLREALGAQAPAVEVARVGDAETAIATAERVFQADYFTPYLAHATLEPQTCTAVVRDGYVDLWTSTQNAEAAHRAAAEAAGTALDKVYLHRTPAGGAFGRRGAQDYVRQGVAIAAALPGVPVKTVWSREEDLQHGHYRPASLVRMRAGMDAFGNPVALHCRVASQLLVTSQAAAAFEDHPYAIGHLVVEHAQRDAPFPVGPWRGGPYSQNPFVRECFLDELAHAGGRDPYELRRSLLPAGAPERAVLEVTAHAAGWESAAPAGVHRGLAVAEARGSFVAAVAEVSVDGGSRVAVHRLVLGIDCGHVVNPDNVAAQLQGSAAFMLGAAFWGEITWRGGRVAQSNFNDYRVLRLAEMPEVDVVIVPSGGFWGGVGEPGVAAVAPALANAIFAATGRPVRSLPLAREGYELARSA